MAERNGQPDQDREIGGLPGAPPCPFCSGAETEVMNPFGAHLSVATYWCRDCRSPFDLLKWQTGAGHGPRVVR